MSSSSSSLARSSRGRGIFGRCFMSGDVLLAVAMCVAMIVANTIVPHHWEFPSPDDPRYQYPVKDPATVPVWLLFLIAWGVAPLLILVGVFVLYLYGWSLKACRRELARGWVTLFLATFVTNVVTTFVKKYVGRPRPNAFALCDYDAVKKECMAPAWKVAVAFQSFPSGHSSLSWSSMMVCALFFLWVRKQIHTQRVRDRVMAASERDGQRDAVDVEAEQFLSIHEESTERLNQFASPLEFQRASETADMLAGVGVANNGNINDTTSALLCIMPLCVSTWVACSRSVDQWHHPSDILAGSLLGAALAIFIFRLKFADRIDPHRLLAHYIVMRSHKSNV